MNNFTYERLHNNLQYLKLNTIEDMLDNLLEVAARDNKTTMEVPWITCSSRKENTGKLCNREKDEKCRFSCEKNTWRNSILSFSHLLIKK